MKELTSAQTVSKGDAITAEAWNGVVRRLNEDEGASAPVRTGGQIKGEFWVRNTTSSSLAPLEGVRVNGFTSTFSTADAARSALATGTFVLNVSKSGGSTRCVVPLEGIGAGQVGRATSAGGALVFTILGGSSLPSVNGRVAFVSSDCVFEADDDGDFVIVARDTTSWLVALAFSPKVTTYSAGGGIYIGDDGEISNTTSFVWGVNNGSSYVQKAASLVGGAPHLRFSSQFKSQAASDSVGVYEVALNTSTVYVAGMDASGNLTRTAIKVVQ